ncbi:MAG: ABC transporter ATP-binding protein [Oscillospiraceae bacterium]|nr:ABC transporter ATP-binding protein [Oscillospiraceae bacterium]
METVLKVEHLTKFFGRRKVVDDVSFEIPKGEVFGFLGPNGAGKTTTIKMIMGFLNIDDGHIKINGFDVVKQREKAMEKVGGIVENPEMYNYLSAQTNLEMYARLHNNVTKERIAEVVEMCGMTKRIHEKVKKYSLGMKQRVSLAQALLCSPNLLILDEPTNGLDPIGIHELRDDLIRLAHKDGIAVFVSSHMLSEMEMMCDRVGILNNGKLLGIKPIDQLIKEASGSNAYRFNVSPIDKAAEIINNYKSKSVVNTGKDFVMAQVEETDVQKLIVLLTSGGVTISGVGKQTASLEDVFMSITGGENSIE